MSNDLFKLPDGRMARVGCPVCRHNFLRVEQNQAKEYCLYCGDSMCYQNTHFFNNRETAESFAINQYKEFIEVVNKITAEAFQVPSNQPEKKNMSKNNLRQILTLLQEGYTTVKVKFKSSTSVMTYKAPIGLLKEGDFVVVIANNSPACVEVVQVDEEPEITGFELKWIVQRVDLHDYEKACERDRMAISIITEAERGIAKNISQELHTTTATTLSEVLAKLNIVVAQQPK